MADINKTIKDIEECLSASCRGYKPKVYCPHRDEEWDIMRDALELLEAQQAEIKRLKDDKANVIKLLEKEREENKPESDYVIRPMRASNINEQHKGMYYAFSFAINALIEKGR